MNKRITLTLVASLLSASTFAGGDASKVDSKSLNTSQQQEGVQVKRQTMNKSEQVQHCKQELANKLGIDQEAISLVSAEEVMWPSGAMGCPSPDRMYTQALIEGVRIVLEANQKQYSYHASKNGVPSYCPRPGNKKPTPLYENS